MAPEEGSFFYGKLETKSIKNISNQGAVYAGFSAFCAGTAFQPNMSGYYLNKLCNKTLPYLLIIIDWNSRYIVDY
jgi:hypothetical protein